MKGGAKQERRRRKELKGKGVPKGEERRERGKAENVRAGGLLRGLTPVQEEKACIRHKNPAKN